MNKLTSPIDNRVNLDEIMDKLRKNPLFKDIDINISNLNSCLIMQDEHLNCLNCQGLDKCPNTEAGYKYVYNEGEFVLLRCNKKRDYDNINRQNSLIKTLYMPKNVREAKLENFILNTKERVSAYKKIVNFITNFEQEQTKGLYIYGNYGSGKTYLLGALANELAKRNIGSLLIYFPDLIRELRDSLGENRFTEIINELKTIPVLIIDDLGSENMTSFVRDEVLGPVLNYRMAENRPIFISSNLTPQQLLVHLETNGSSLDKTKSIRIMQRIGQISEAISLGGTFVNNDENKAL